MWGDGNNNNKGSDTTFGKPMRHLGGKVWEYSYSSSESWKMLFFQMVALALIINPEI